MIKIKEKDLVDILSMKARDKVKSIFKKQREKNHKCNYPRCNTSDKFETVHKKGYQRTDLVSKIIHSNKNKIFNKDEFWKSFEKRHLEQSIVLFLCGNCHKKYDKDELDAGKLKNKWIKLKK